MNRKSNYKEYLKSHKTEKGGKEITNTSIKGYYGGNFHIPQEEYGEFLAMYYREVVSKGGDEFLTEKQMQTGPIAVDLDFRYELDVDEKQYDLGFIKTLMLNYLDVCKDVFQLEPNKTIPFYVFEKPDVNHLPEKNITKDGIHMLIGIHCGREVQRIIRDKVIVKTKEEFDEFPIINSWEDVFDEGISKGTVNWQLYGSKKPDHQSYRLTHAYTYEYDASDGEFMEKKVDLKTFNWERDIFKLSVRYDKHPEFFVKSNIAGIVNSMKSQSPRKMVRNEIRASRGINILNVKNHDELKACVDEFLAGLGTTEYNIREAHEYTMILPISYYGNGSYEKWIRVGWVLANIHDKLFISWIAFSAQSPVFDFNEISSMYDMWTKFDHSKHGLNKGSLVHWARNDAKPADFQAVRENGVQYYVNLTIRSLSFGGGKGDKTIGSGDSDLANILYMLYKHKYACASVKYDKWYRFLGHRYVEDEMGTSLRHHISEELRDVYRKKGDELSDSVVDKNQGDDKLKVVENQSNKLLDIVTRLGRTSHKDHIMKEAKELFFDPDLKFLDLLDSNPYLLCFKNGVIDIKNCEFRAGRPDDYLEKCTNINYVPLDEVKHKTTIDEINDFMDKLFPRPQLRAYMWEHLASILLGINLSQKMHIYIGAGSNGKSVLTDLLSQCLGDYYAVVPISLITQARQKQGSASPDIVSLRGLRMAVMQEPSKNDQINDGAMKELTSGVEPIKGRQLYGTLISFVPQCKITVCSNNFMKVQSQDHGTWRRIAVCDFESRFCDEPEEDDEDMPFQYKGDPMLKEKFPEWREVFMAMLVKIVFKTQGKVKPCKMVDDASLKYKNREDHISEFITERIIIDPNGRITKTEINTEFNIWYQGTYGRGGPSTKEVHECLDKDKRFSKYKNAVGAWVGARIRYDQDYNDSESDDESDQTISSDDL
jgi:P4 family phage/plasmid primase-like protien